MVKARVNLIFVFIGILACCLPRANAFQLGEDGPRVSGFFEAAFGVKLGNDSAKRDAFNLAEQRLQLETMLYPEAPDLLRDWRTEISLKGDFLVDEYFGGKTDFQLRELNALFTPISWMDVKLGRQVFTWGTGDYLFVNDLFSKDYVSFYIGRDDEYLKKPSDGVRVSAYTPAVNIDLAVIPFFEPNTIFKGDRLSFFDSLERGITGRESDRFLNEPSTNLKNTEYGLRLYRNLNRYEVALYFFRGFYKMPKGYLNEAEHELFYPRLDAYGASLRGPFAGGIANFEYAYYNSRQDTNGDNRLIANSMNKYLIGYRKDLGNDLTVGIQYLYEHTLDYDALRRSLLAQDYTWDEHRHLLTFRVTKLFKDQTVKADVFTFYSPTDNDVYLRPVLSYDVTDSFNLTFGANLIWGQDDLTDFGQLENNKNIYLCARYSF